MPQNWIFCLSWIKLDQCSIWNIQGGKEIWENAKLFTCLLACLVCTIKSCIVPAEGFHGSFHLHNWSLWLYSILYIYLLCNIKVQLCDLFETKNEIKRSVSFVTEFESRYRELFDKGPICKWIKIFKEPLPSLVLYHHEMNHFVNRAKYYKIPGTRGYSSPLLLPVQSDKVITNLTLQFGEFFFQQRIENFFLKGMQLANNMKTLSNCNASIFTKSNFIIEIERKRVGEKKVGENINSTFSIYISYIEKNFILSFILHSNMMFHWEN